MSVKSKNGEVLKPGDLVTIEAVVKQTFEGDGPGNVIVETLEAVAGAHPATFHTSGTKLVKVAEVKAVAAPVAAPAEVETKTTV